MKITLDLEKLEQSLPLVKDGLLPCLEGAAWTLNDNEPENLDGLETETLLVLISAIVTAAEARDIGTCLQSPAGDWTLGMPPSQFKRG